MRRQKLQKEHVFKPSNPRSKLCLPAFFALATCGLLFAGTLALTTMATESAPVVSQTASQTPSAIPKTPAGLGIHYVGDEACLPCHRDMVNTYHQTAHFHTSSWPTKDSIHGNFNPGFNILETRATNLFFRMDANANDFFQTAVLKTSPTEVKSHTERFDVVFGSGRKGQTYLYWHHDRLYDRDELFELPVSYWVERGIWMNSPGLVEFPDGTANFARPVTQRCLECHTTAFEWLEPAGNRFNQFNKTNLVLGIICEKCHGPGAEHVARYRSASPPKSAATAAIINPVRLHPGPANGCLWPVSCGHRNRTCSRLDIQARRCAEQ